MGLTVVGVGDGCGCLSNLYCTVFRASQVRVMRVIIPLCKGAWTERGYLTTASVQESLLDRFKRVAVMIHSTVIDSIRLIILV